jgi:cbb3-type cytochrome oxidase subunit 3
MRVDGESFIIGLLLVMLVSFFVALGYLLYQDGKKSAAAKQAFMQECRQDKKQYECDAMWRAGNSNNSYVPIPIIIPMR